MENFDLKYTQARKLALSLANDMPALVKDMTDSDPSWGIVTELDDLTKKMADVLARFYEADLYGENEVEAYYTILSNSQAVIDKADKEALKAIRLVCSQRDEVSTVQLRKAAYALGADADDFTADRPRGSTKDARNMTRIKSAALVSWINQKEAE